VPNAADLVRALGASEHRLFQLLEHVPVGIFVVAADGNASYANRVAREILGRDIDLRITPEQLSASYGLYVAGTTQLYPHERIPITRALRGESIRVADLEIRRDGRSILLEVSAAPLLDEHGAVSYAIATLADITETERISQLLHESERGYRDLFVNAPIGIYRTTPDGRILMANPALLEMLGYDPLDDDVFPLHHDGSALTASLDRFGEVRNLEGAWQRPDGATLYVNQNARVVRDEHDSILYYEGTVEDITARRAAEEELRTGRDAAVESVRLKSEFLANVSHEIRTPMNGVIGMADLLVAGALTADQRDYAQTIRQSAESLLRIVDDILDFSKMEAGKLTMNAVDFDLDELIDDITDIFAERAATKGIRFRSIIYPDVTRQLRGDAMRIRQVIVNLVGNAIKFTAAGDVTLSVMQDSQSDEGLVLWFLVNDTGIGISTADQERLFTPFVQVDGKSTRKFGGTGLGLAISKQLVTLLAGRIGMASVPAEGSTFWFTVPLEKGVAPAAPPKRAALAGLRALVVEGDEVNRLVLRRHLSSAAMHVDEAPGVFEAMEAIRAAALTQPYDVVVVDMQLPKADGLALARAIRAEEYDIISRTPVVLITAIGRRKSDVDAFRTSGVSTFIIKPVRQSQLTAAVAGVVERGPEPSPDAFRQERTGEVPAARVAQAGLSRILVVEDNVVNQKVALGQLRHLGYSAEVVGSGREAIEAVRGHTYDLILLDCQMPDIDGYEVAEEIRRLEDGRRRTPIIAMTAHVLEDERDRCVKAGMDDYLTKPVSTARLGDTIGRYLAPRAPVDGALDDAKIAGLREVGRTNPKFLTDITHLFREDALLRLHDLRDAVDSRNADALARAAHALKSSSGNVGATRIYTICTAIEENARNGSIDGAGDLVYQLAAELDVAVAALTLSARPGRS
jgi:two-component system sensor histidine kinase/response regulator